MNAPAQDEPAGQRSALPLPPGMATYVPGVMAGVRGLQKLTPAAPVKFAYVRAGHGVHVVAPAFEYVLMGQDTGAAAPPVHVHPLGHSAPV